MHLDHTKRSKVSSKVKFLYDFDKILMAESTIYSYAKYESSGMVELGILLMQS